MFQVTLILIISAATGLLAAIIYWVQRKNLYRGYEPIIEAARQIAATMKAGTFRDGDDLVIAGSFQRFPAIVRFSYHQNTPGMHIEMHAPTTFDLWLSPKKVTTTKGRTVVRTGNSALDSRFNARTDHPTQSRMLFGDKVALSHLEKLCCSTNTDFAVGDGKMDLTELSIPAYPARHVTDHLESLNILADLLAKMPGAHEIKLPSVRQERRTWIYPALGTVLLLAIAVVLFSVPEKKAADTGRPVPLYVPAGMESLDAEHLQRLDGWRVASSDDFSAAAAQYLEQHGLPVAGKLKADFAGRGSAADSAYLLLDSQGKRRVVMLAAGVSVYDAIFDRVDLLAVLPKESLANVSSTTGSKLDSDGDGLLVVTDVTNPASGVVLVKHGKEMDSARPLDFTTINLYSGQ